jgi:hypothetical protein
MASKSSESSQSPPEQKAVPLDYGRAADGPPRRQWLVVLLMYALPAAASTICFWFINGKFVWSVLLTACLFDGPFFPPLVRHYKLTEFLATVAAPAVGSGILAAWLAFVMCTPLRRMPPLVHLMLCAIWMGIGVVFVVLNNL